MNVQKIALLRSIERRQFMQMCAGSLTVATIGCRRGGDPAYRGGNTLVMAVESVEDVKPDNSDLDFLLFPRLAALDANGELEPRLAQSWERSVDYREWTYQLRTDVRWDDGKPVTAHDVKFTLDLLSHPDVAEYNFESVTVLDDYTVKIRAASAYQADTTYFPKHLLERLEPKKYYQWDFWTHPVGSGPYRFVRYLPNTMMELEANPNYYRDKPKIERVVLKFVGKAGLNELLSGNADVAYGNPAQIPFVAKDARFRVYHWVRPGARAIYWKCDHPLFHDVRVRRALTLAIDRRALLGVLNLPSDLVPITDGVFTERQIRRRPLPEPLPYDPPQSRALLEAAGWQDRDADGVREREGRPFRFTAIVRAEGGLDRLAVYVQAQLRQVGVQMEVQVLDPGVVGDRLRSGDFEAVFGGFDVGWYHPQKYLGRDNPIGYRNPEVVRLTDQAMATADPDELDRIYQALTEIFRADLPLTRLLPWTFPYFAHRRVRGLSTPFHAQPDTYMEDLWLEDGP
jgi:peptide/nickel transport system substrate-binding protein